MRNQRKILERLFYSKIPLTKSMGVRVTEYDGNCLILAAPLKPNINVHGTAFAGSLYSIAALAGWGLLYLKLMDEKLMGDIVIGEGKISYNIPVTNKIEAHCRFSDKTQLKAFIERLRAKRRARIALRSEVLLGLDVAALYDGQYFVRA